MKIFGSRLILGCADLFMLKFSVLNIQNQFVSVLVICCSVGLLFFNENCIYLISGGSQRLGRARWVAGGSRPRPNRQAAETTETETDSIILHSPPHNPPRDEILRAGHPHSI